MSRRPSRDPGLQPERTLFSWHRTLILGIVVALFYLRGSFSGQPAADQEPGALLRLVPVSAAVLVVCLLMVHLRRRWRSVGHGTHGDDTGTPPAPLARPWAMLLLSGCAGGIGVLVAISVFTG